MENTQEIIKELKEKIEHFEYKERRRDREMKKEFKNFTSGLSDLLYGYSKTIDKIEFSDRWYLYTITESIQKITRAFLGIS